MVPRGHDSCDVRLCQGKLKMHIKSNCFYGISNSHSGLQDGKIVQCTKVSRRRWFRLRDYLYSIKKNSKKNIDFIVTFILWSKSYTSCIWNIFSNLGLLWNRRNGISIFVEYKILQPGLSKYSYYYKNVRIGLSHKNEPIFWHQTSLLHT